MLCRKTIPFEQVWKTLHATYSPTEDDMDLSRKDFDKSYEEKKTVTLFNPALPKLI